MATTQTNVAPAFHKTTQTFTAGAKTLPQRYFVSPEIFVQEQTKIFSGQWVLIGHQSQIAKAGDYLTSQLAGESLIVVRDKSGEITGTNMKRHLALLACFAATLTPAEAATKIRIMYTAVGAYASSFVAKDQGFFAKRGLDVTLQIVPQGSTIASAMAGGT